MPQLRLLLLPLLPVAACRLSHGGFEKPIDLHFKQIAFFSLVLLLLLLCCWCVVFCRCSCEMCDVINICFSFTAAAAVGCWLLLLLLLLGFYYSAALGFLPRRV